VPAVERRPVYDRLRDMIVLGDLEAGSALDVDGVAGELGPEDHAGHEAVYRLNDEGFVERAPDGALRVALLTHKDSTDLIDAFELLMPPVYRLATRLLTAEDLAEMRTALDAAAAAVLQKDGVGVLANWGRFHEVALTRVGNQEFLRFWRSLWPRTKRFALQWAQHFPEGDANRHLEQVYDGLERRQANEVVRPLLQNYERLRAAVQGRRLDV
jgi:DNA-binding GntR family transcriptional regulator